MRKAPLIPFFVTHSSGVDPEVFFNFVSRTISIEVFQLKVDILLALCANIFSARFVKRFRFFGNFVSMPQPVFKLDLKKPCGYKLEGFIYEKNNKKSFFIES